MHILLSELTLHQLCNWMLDISNWKICVNPSHSWENSFNEEKCLEWMFPIVPIYAYMDTWNMGLVLKMGMKSTIYIIFSLIMDTRHYRCGNTFYGIWKHFIVCIRILWKRWNAILPRIYWVSCESWQANYCDESCRGYNYDYECQHEWR